MSAKINYAFLFIWLGIFLFRDALAQGPLVSYYYNPSTQLSWAECYIYQPGGSKQEIPFFIVANQNYHWAALGTKKYSKDCDIVDSFQINIAMDFVIVRSKAMKQSINYKEIASLCPL